MISKIEKTWLRMIVVIIGLLLSFSLTVYAEGYYTVYDKKLTESEYIQFNEDLDKAQTADEVQAVFDKYGINQNIEALINGEAPNTVPQNNTAEEGADITEEDIEEVVENEEDIVSIEEEKRQEQTDTVIEVREAEEVIPDEIEDDLVVEDDINYGTVILVISFVIVVIAAVLVILGIRTKRK